MLAMGSEVFKFEEAMSGEEAVSVIGLKALIP